MSLKTIKLFNKNIVAFGGGTGLATLIRGLKTYTSNITAVVTVADDGGSSGALRSEYGILPPGDIRNCLVALSREENLMAKLFQYRFPKQGNLSGHSFGNIFITAMSALMGSFDKGIARAGEVLSIDGKVLPTTLSSITLKAKLIDGKVVKGETNISKSISRIEKLSIHPSMPPVCPRVLDAIKSADAIVIGPGSLYTSVIASMLATGIQRAIEKADVPKIYICNIMTQKSETIGYKLSDHITAILKHIGKKSVNYAVVNSGSIPENMKRKYAGERAYPVINDTAKHKNIKIVKSNFVSKDEYARHDSNKLASAVVRIIKGEMN